MGRKYFFKYPQIHTVAIIYGFIANVIDQWPVWASQLDFYSVHTIDFSFLNIFVYT